IYVGGYSFQIEKIKGKKTLILPLEDITAALKQEKNEDKLVQIGGLKAKVLVKGYTLLTGEKAELIFRLVKELDLWPIDNSRWNRKININLHDEADLSVLIKNLPLILAVTEAKIKSKELGFICLYIDNRGTYWFKVSRGFATALNESISSLESLIDDASEILKEEDKALLSSVYRKLTDIFNG
ncbi:MAG: ATP-dependent RNA helicase, partial [Candidatus Treponema excrementipullorum]|nr:ATP-dependent RNA helicase [Candidatus Treponema excrementipullorum]